MSEANYNGKQPNNTSYIKKFVTGVSGSLWKAMNYEKPDGTNDIVVTTNSPKYTNVYIPGNLYVDGFFLNPPSDINLKKNITSLNIDITDKIMKLNPTSFEFKNDPYNNIHYGFIANELETEYPELVHTKPDQIYNTSKAVNYLEMIPLLVHKIQLMQKEIDVLKLKLDNL
jgi:hypothetical protein